MPERQQRGVSNPGLDKYGVDAFVKKMERDLSIDKFALDDSLAEVGQIFQDVGEEIAFAISRRDEAKDEVARTEAEIDGIVRRDGVQTGMKVTDTAAKNLVIMHRDVITARQRLRNREEDLARLQGLERSFTQRSYAIREMVSLHLAAYFGTTANVVRHEVNREGQERRTQDIRRSQNAHRHSRDHR